MRNAIAITGGRALVGDDLTVLEDATILIRGQRIEAVGEITPPPDALVVDAQGLTLLPGFIDAHVHIGFFQPRDVLAGGVTTVRDLGWPPQAIFPLAQQSLSPFFDGPTIYAAGPMLTAPDGYPMKAAWAPLGTGHEVFGQKDAAEVVAQMVFAGAAIIKVALNPAVGPSLSLRALSAIVLAAHERSLKVTGHVYGLEELDKALDAGMDEIAHMLMSSEQIGDDTIERMVEQEMAVVPTLSIRLGRDKSTAIDNTRRFAAAGGNVVYGTDLGNEGPRPGIDPGEINAMTKAGFSPTEIIHSATVSAARWLGLEATGSIAAGKYADIVAVAGDPTRDVRALTKVKKVWRRGIIRRDESR